MNTLGSKRMIIGVPKEIKNNEYRVGMVPAGARQLTRAGHTVLVESHAGEGSALAGRTLLADGKATRLRRNRRTENDAGRATDDQRTTDAPHPHGTPS